MNQELKLLNITNDSNKKKRSAVYSETLEFNAYSEFDSIRFDSIRFVSIRFDSFRLISIRFDSLRFDSIRFEKLEKFGKTKSNI